MERRKRRGMEVEKENGRRESAKENERGRGTKTGDEVKEERVRRRLTQAERMWEMRETNEVEIMDEEEKNTEETRKMKETV